MSKINKKIEVEAKDIVLESEISDQFNSNFTEYAYKTLEDRALPDARDGLKPSQRRILLALDDLKLFNSGATEKVSKVVGTTMGEFHPHGNMVIFPALARMVQSWIMRYPLIEGQGNFGSRDGSPPAAERYVESKFSKQGEALLEDLSEKTVEHILNYNEKRLEPKVLPSKIPNLLLNGCSGIAVGWATSMPPHNLKEICTLIIEWIKNPQMTVEQAIKIVPGPDFPTGGKLLGQDGVISYFKTGRGSMILEGKYQIDISEKLAKIIITELPYGTGQTDFLNDIKTVVEQQTIKGISDVLDLSSNTVGMRIEIEISKNTSPELILNQLLKHTCLRKTISVNQTVLIDGKTVKDQVTMFDLIEAFVKHRIEVLTNKFKAELITRKDRLEILEGLISVSKNIDKTIKIIKDSENPDEAKKDLISSGIIKTEVQANSVLSITLRTLTKLEAKNIEQEYLNIEKRIEWLNNTLSDVKNIKELIIKEQEDNIKEFGDDRRTSIEKVYSDISDEDLIKDERVIVTITSDGYAKRLPLDTYSQQGRGGRGVSGLSLKDDENNTVMLECSTKDIILFFTNTGMCYNKKAYSIPESSKSSKGTHLANILSLMEGESVISTISTKTMNELCSICFITKNGIIKKTKISEFETCLKSRGIAAIKIDKDDSIINAFITCENDDVLILTKDGNSVRYSSSKIKNQGRNTRGSRGAKLRDGDRVVYGLSFNKKDDLSLLILTENGYCKRTKVSEYRAVENKNSKGVSAIKKSASAKIGSISSACVIDDNSSVLISTLRGKVIKLSTNDMRETGRTSSGVKAVKLDESDKAIYITSIIGIKEEVSV